MHARFLKTDRARALNTFSGVVLVASLHLFQSCAAGSAGPGGGVAGAGATSSGGTGGGGSEGTGATSGGSGGATDGIGVTCDVRPGACGMSFARTGSCVNGWVG